LAVAALLLVGALGFLAGLFPGDGSSFMFGFIFAVGAGLYALITWVLFGWFEQTLRMLATIADNTASAGYGAVGAPPFSG
jgi:hypothetical protein